MQDNKFEDSDVNSLEAAEALNAHHQAIIELQGGRKIIGWFITALSVAALICLVVEGYIIYKMPKTDAIVQKVQAEMPAPKDNTAAVESVKDEVEQVKTKAAGNAEKFAELEKKMTAQMADCNKADTESSARIDKVAKATDENKTLMETVSSKLDEIQKGLEAGHAAVQVTPSSPAPVEASKPSRIAVNDAPSPNRFLEEQTLSRDVVDSDVYWKKIGKYYLPLWKTNNRGVTSSSEPRLTKPKGLENAKWVVINGQDWALEP